MTPEIEPEDLGDSDQPLTLQLPKPKTVGNGPLTGIKALECQERELAALELRKTGMGYDEIARNVGFKGKDGAFRAVVRALQRALREPAAEVRRLEEVRLDAMLVAVWPSVLRGDFKAIDRAIKIMERRAKLLGLDAPLVVDIQSRLEKLAEEAGLDPKAAVEEAQAIATSLMNLPASERNFTLN